MAKKLEEMSFKELMEQLEEVAGWLEQDQTDLDQALDKFENGMELADELRSRLAKAEQKITKIKSKHQAENSEQ